MRSLNIFILCNIVALSSIAQSSQTVTLVFVNSSTDHKNYEAIIDDVSYFSENDPVISRASHTNAVTNNRNIIWLNNFQTGQHSIQIFNVKKGEERSSSKPVFSSNFTVRPGFDAQIAVRNNGQVQFSERESNINNSEQMVERRNNNHSSTTIVTTKENKTSLDHSNLGNNSEKNSFINFADSDLTRNNSDVNYTNAQGQKNIRMSHKRTDASTNSVYEENQTSEHDRIPIDDNQFNDLLQSTRKHWLPGERMATVKNEFVSVHNYFTTSQAKQLIELVTEESNRLQLAKASYHCISDPENFTELYNVFKTQGSKNELDDYIRNYH